MMRFSGDTYPITISVRKIDGVYAYPYAAKILGIGDGPYFAREFVPGDNFEKTSTSVDTTHTVFVPQNNVYEIGIVYYDKETTKKVSRDKLYFAVKDNEVYPIAANNVLATLYRMAAGTF